MANYLPPIDRPITVVPPLTPFTTDLKVDYEQLKKLVDYVVVDCRATMVVAAGVEAQEYQYLDGAARRELIAKTIQFVDGRAPVVVGVTHPSFREAAELAHFAEKNGAACVQALAPLRPIGGATPVADLVRYFDCIGRETNLPLMLYLNPGPGAEVSPADTLTISKLDRIKYVKESSRDLSRVSRLLVEIEHGGHAHYLVTMQMLLACLPLGCKGVTLPPPASFLATRIIDAFVAGDYVEASRLQLQFALYPARWMDAGLATVMKASMTALGIPCGSPYPPYPPLGAERLAQLEAFLKTTDLAPAQRT